MKEVQNIYQKILIPFKHVCRTLLHFAITVFDPLNNRVYVKNSDFWRNITHNLIVHLQNHDLKVFVVKFYTE